VYIIPVSVHIRARMSDWSATWGRQGPPWFTSISALTPRS
jgi:hypothetical protein